MLFCTLTSVLHSFRTHLHDNTTNRIRNNPLFDWFRGRENVSIPFDFGGLLIIVPVNPECFKYSSTRVLKKNFGENNLHVVAIRLKMFLNKNTFSIVIDEIKIGTTILTIDISPILGLG